MNHVCCKCGCLVTWKHTSELDSPICRAETGWKTFRGGDGKLGAAPLLPSLNALGLGWSFYDHFTLTPWRLTPHTPEEPHPLLKGELMKWHACWLHGHFLLVSHIPKMWHRLWVKQVTSEIYRHAYIPQRVRIKTKNACSCTLCQPTFSVKRQRINLFRLNVSVASTATLLQPCLYIMKAATDKRSRNGVRVQ